MVPQLGTSLYHSPNVVKGVKSRRLKWAGHIARLDFKILTGKRTGKKPRGSPELRLEEILECTLKK
jgi:hypothetical protein